jgi:ribosomal protein S18 acetylase RimI-like enzyme
MDNLSIREYQKKDFEHIVDLMTMLQSYFKEIDISGEKIEFENRESAEEYVQKALKDDDAMDGKLFVAESEGKITGFIQGVIIKHNKDVMFKLTHRKRKDGWIGLLFVNPDARGKGVAQLLISTIREYFKNNGCVSMRLKVDSNNKLALNVYNKYGFKPGDLEMATKI